MSKVENHKVVSREEWLRERKTLLAKEKALTRQRDQLSTERRNLPWVKVDKQYVFNTPSGKKTLADLFDGNSQLIIQHFMFAPDWEAGCIGCSLMADHVDAANIHLMHHDVTYVAVARAPLGKLKAYWRRMGWSFCFASSLENDFNYDFNVSFTPDEMDQGQVYYNFEETAASIEELHGMSVFYRDENGDIFHTYSVYARGDEEVMGAYKLLDMTPKGRNETGPNYNLMDWVKRHDEYREINLPVECCH
jgi:predicted dithiol-disulfide oxidoreductase (DUF899 family)